MPSTQTFYPNFFGKNSEKVGIFRLQTEYPVGDRRRYPIGTKFPFQVDVAFGLTNTGQRRTGALHVNTLEAIKASANKLEAKEIWDEQEMAYHAKPYAPLSRFVDEEGFFDGDAFISFFGANNKVVIKAKTLSGGRGMKIVSNFEELREFLIGEFANPQENSRENTEKFFFEGFFPNTREYRIHVSPFLYNVDVPYQFEYSRKDGNAWVRHMSPEEIRSNGVILAQKKVIRQEAWDAGVRTRNLTDSNSVYFTTEFTKPANWGVICEEAVSAISALNLDFGFVDCLYNSETSEFCFAESGSNPGMSNSDDRPTLNITAQHYLQAFPKIIHYKASVDPRFARLLPPTPRTLTEAAERINAQTRPSHFTNRFKIN